MLTEQLLNLPWQAVTVLASGYAAYFIAYFGIRAWHRSVDTVFITLVFALIATAILATATKYTVYGAAAAAFMGACLCAIVWRKYFREVLHRTLRKWDVSWSNDDPSALATLSANSKYALSQVAVETDDGSWLRCDDTKQFHDAPFGPVVLGQNGDVALYLTHITIPGKNGAAEQHRTQETVRDGYYGDRINYVPASRIRQITFRLKRPD